MASKTKQTKKKETTTRGKIFKFHKIADEKIRKAQRLIDEASAALGNCTNYTRQLVEDQVNDEELRKHVNFSVMLRDSLEDLAAATNAEDRVFKVQELLRDVF